MTGITLSTLESPLTEGRGLKCDGGLDLLIVVGVAPHGGAWIEIELRWKMVELSRVAPHGGAWIEIPASDGGGWKLSSPLTEGRGLKLSCRGLTAPARGVAPHGGAWIEISLPSYRVCAKVSPLTEGRGLK